MSCLQSSVTELILRSVVVCVQLLELFLKVLFLLVVRVHIVLVEWFDLALRDRLLVGPSLPPTSLATDIACTHLEASIFFISSLHHFCLVERYVLLCVFHNLICEGTCFDVNLAALLPSILPKLTAPGLNSFDLINILVKNFGCDLHIYTFCL